MKTGGSQIDRELHSIPSLLPAGMDSEIVLRSVPTVFSSPSLLGMIQAFKLADQIMGSHPGEASESVG